MAVPKLLVRLRLIIRHQLAAAMGTMADFTTMMALVELVRLSPPVATAFSAALGGLVNFGISRGWAFRRHHRGTLGSQAVRYGVTSLGGATLNAGLLALVLRAIELPYPIARALVAFGVSLFYTYPMHTRVVFRVRRSEAECGAGGVTRTKAEG
jgi:putative flippase GtrA